MATATGKAARRKWGTMVAAKKARKHKVKDFGTPEQEKAQYREMKRRQRER